MITVEEVVYVRVELPHSKLMEFSRRMLDAEIYSIRNSVSMWCAVQPVPEHPDGEMWYTAGEFYPLDRDRIVKIHDEVAG